MNEAKLGIDIKPKNLGITPGALGYAPAKIRIDQMKSGQR